MKKAIALALSLAMVVSLLAGCSSSTSSDSTSSDSSASSSTSSSTSSSSSSTSTDSTEAETAVDPSVEPDGVVPGSVANFYSNADCVTQLLPSQYPSGHWMYGMIYDTLFWSPSGNYDDMTGLLVKEWEISDDNLVWTLTLHDNVYFANGNKLNAESCLSAWALIQANGGAASAFAPLVSYEATGEYELTFVYDAPNPEVMHQFAVVHTSIFDSSLCDADGGSWQVENMYMVGSGPYYISDYGVGDYMTFTAVEDHWNADRQAHIETLNCKVILDTNTQTTALLSGEMDAGPVTSYDAYETLLTADLQYDQYYGNSRPLWVNVDEGLCPYLANDRVREALVLMIDLDELAYAASGGYGMALPNAFNDVLTYDDGNAYDPDAALAILAEEGIDPADITLVALCDATVSDMITNLQAQFAECGVTVDFSVQDSPAVMSAGWAGEWDIWTEHGGLSRYSYSSPVGMMLGRTGTHNMCHDVDLDPILWDLCDEAFTQPTFDEEVEVMNEIAQVLAENYAYFGSILLPAWNVFSEDMQGIVVDQSNGSWRANDAWLA